MKKAYFLLGLIGLILIIAIVLRLTSSENNWVCQNGKWLKHGNPDTAMPTTSCPGEVKIVGSDKDEHGCIASAGYSWCEVKQKCLRAWEEKCELESKETIQKENDLLISATDEILVLNPKQKELVSSPLEISGQARGNWFFEASLPVELFSSDGQLIVSSSAQALDDWMTTKPVRFSSSLAFSTNATSGYLVIAKDNPSGLPQNEGSIKVPVRFK